MTSVTENITARKKVISNEIIGKLNHHDIKVFVKDENDDVYFSPINIRCDEDGDIIIEIMQ